MSNTLLFYRGGGRSGGGGGLPAGTKAQAGSMSRIIFAPKLSDETALYAFDFSSRLNPGETISTAVCSATVYSGTDPTPSAIVSGAASISGAVVSQLFTAGVLGATYGVECDITTNLSQAIALVAYLTIVPDLP